MTLTLAPNITNCFKLFCIFLFLPYISWDFRYEWQEQRKCIRMTSVSERNEKQQAKKKILPVQWRESVSTKELVRQKKSTYQVYFYSHIVEFWHFGWCEIVHVCGVYVHDICLCYLTLSSCACMRVCVYIVTEQMNVKKFAVFFPLLIKKHQSFALIFIISRKFQSAGVHSCYHFTTLGQRKLWKAFALVCIRTVFIEINYLN